MRLLQIVPGFGKTDNALFDYAKILAEELNKKGIESIFDIEKVGECDAVFLNYVGYGYEKRGVPILFYWQLKKLLKLHKIPLITFFHELYASGYPPWTSSFWLSRLQKKIYKAIYDNSDIAFCSNRKMFDQVIQQTKDQGERMRLINIFSNVPELDIIVDSDNRENTAVIFGTYFRRNMVYERLDILSKFCECLQIKKLIDIGDGDFDNIHFSIPIESLGKLDVHEIATIFRKAKFGILCYEADVLEKSGILAAYVSNGLIPVNLYKNPSLRKIDSHERVQLINENNLSNWDEKIEGRSIIQNNHLWYEPRTRLNHALSIYKHVYPLLMNNKCE